MSGEMPANNFTGVNRFNYGLGGNRQLGLAAIICTIVERFYLYLHF
nr:hypothetical protein [Cylindrospermopsis raciborskii]